MNNVDSTNIVNNLPERCWQEIGVWGNSNCELLNKHYHCRNCDIYLQQGSELFAKKIPDDYRKDWTKKIAAEKQIDNSVYKSCLAFKLNDKWLGINNNIVEAVIETIPIHSLPNISVSFVRGIINFRGQIKLTVCLKTLLGFAKAQANKGLTKMIVVKKNDNSWAFECDEIMGVVKYPIDKNDELIEENENTELVYDTINIDDKKVVLISEEVLFDIINKQVYQTL